jgi:hypothetical protein
MLVETTRLSESEMMPSILSWSGAGGWTEGRAWVALALTYYLPRLFIFSIWFSFQEVLSVSYTADLHISTISYLKS